jgi:hypothetical protein
MTVTINGTTGIDSPGGDVSVSQSLSGNLTFTGTGNRIRGDFSNATVANRVAFQSSTTNGPTQIQAMPNGTATQSQFTAVNGTDLNNVSGVQIRATATEAALMGYNTGSASSLPMTFYTGGSERVRIDTSGNVGIGTSSPTRKLDVVAGDGGTNTRLAGASYAIRVQSLASIGAVIEATNNAESTYQPLVVGGSQIQFTISGTERARIDSAGNVGINNASPTQRLSVAGNLNVTGGQLIAGGTTAFSDGTIGSPSLQFNGFTGSAVGAVSIANTTTELISIAFRNPNGYVGNISTSGSGTSYNTTSDYRLKENPQPMTGALEKVAALKPCTYTWKADGSAGQGFIAHELQEVVPDCVTGEKDAKSSDGSPMYQGVDTSFLVATLVSAIQEQQALIQDLTARLEAVESK